MTNMTLARPVPVSLRRGFKPLAIKFNPRAYVLLAPSWSFSRPSPTGRWRRCSGSRCISRTAGDITFVGLGNFIALAQDPSFRRP